jgi:hypothetical protein
MSKTLKKIDGDIYLPTSNGRPEYIEGIEKLSQDTADALLTEYDPDRQFGSELASLNDQPVKSGVLGVFNKAFLMQRARDAIDRLRALQNLRQDQLTSFEAIKEVGTIRVFQISQTGYILWIDVHPMAGPDKAPTSFKVNLRHQFLNSAQPNLPGSIVTDDTYRF